jgi:hypothetical protein
VSVCVRVCVYVCVTAYSFNTVARSRFTLCEYILRVTKSCMDMVLHAHLRKYAHYGRAHYGTDSLKHWSRHALGHKNVHGILDSYACARHILNGFDQN